MILLVGPCDSCNCGLCCHSQLVFPSVAVPGAGRPGQTPRETWCMAPGQIKLSLCRVLPAVEWSWVIPQAAGKRTDTLALTMTGAEGGCDFSQSYPNPGRAWTPDQPAKYLSQVDDRMEEIKPLRSVTLNAEWFTEENVAVELNSSLKGIGHMNSSEKHSFNCCFVFFTLPWCTVTKHIWNKVLNWFYHFQSLDKIRSEFSWILKCIPSKLLLLLEILRRTLILSWAKKKDRNRYVNFELLSLKFSGA